MACRAKRIINLHRNGMDACNSGDLEGAVGKLRTALDEVRAIGLECYQAKIMNNLGIVLEMKGEPAQAREHYQAALEMIQGKLGGETVLGRVMAENLDRVSRSIAVH
ncbi:MAG: tetratricopeptide repeat protein [Desulfarculaceae bacterium]|nr:tetratricopeptide repeat protein [Desulfarculaceae bacterium]